MKRITVTILLSFGLTFSAQADVFVFNKDGSVTAHQDQDFRSRANPDIALKLEDVLRRGEAYLPLAEAAAEKHDVPANLLMAIMAVESAFDPEALSQDSALGLMQLIPGTAQDMEYGWYDMIVPEYAIDAGAKLVARYLKKYNGDIELVLAAYNAGPGRVSQYGGVPPFEETIHYIKNIRGILGHNFDGRPAELEEEAPAPVVIFSKEPEPEPEPKSDIEIFEEAAEKLPPLTLKVVRDNER